MSDQVLALLFFQLRRGWLLPPPRRIGASVARRGGGDGGAVRVAAAALATRRSRRSVKNDELKALEDGQGITFTRKKRFNNGEKCNALQQPPLTHTH